MRVKQSDDTGTINSAQLALISRAKRNNNVEDYRIIHRINTNERPFPWIYISILAVATAMGLLVYILRNK